MRQGAYLAVALVLGAVVPWLFVRMLVPALAAGRTVRNYRGRQVYPGLGIVWLVWAGCAIIGAMLAANAAFLMAPSVLVLAGPLALVAFALGVVDDAYGTAEARGFRGHLKAMMRGRLTTGGLKLIGIGTASLVVAVAVGPIAPWGGEPWDIALGAKVLVAGAAIALTSNLLNLLDLRPGRALKSYGVLAVAGVASTSFATSPALTLMGSARPAAPADTALSAAILAIFLLGPVLAVWRYDLGEEGMLGDAGANPMGAVAGLMIVFGLPLWALVAYVALVLAANLASERFSFTSVIESNAALRWLDGLGRLDVSEEAEIDTHDVGDDR